MAARYDFASDNVAGAMPEAIEALVSANQGFASGYGATLLPEVAINIEVRDERVKLLRFIEPQPRRNIGLAWRSTSPRKADFLEFGRMVLGALKCEQSHRAELRLAADAARAVTVS